MLILGNGDSLRGAASVAAVVDFSFHGLDGTALTFLAEGQLPVADGELYPATATVVVKSMVLVNTHTSAVTINLTILKSGSAARRLIPKNMSLGIGFSLYFDGTRLYVINASGEILHTVDTSLFISDEAYAATWDGITDKSASKNALYDKIELLAPKSSPVFTGQATIPTIDLTGGQIAFPGTAVPSADPNTLDDYGEKEWTPSIGGDATYTTQYGASTKIGRRVFFNSRLTIDVIGTGSTNTVSGLPFAQGVITKDAVNVAYFANIATNVVFISGYIQGATLVFVSIVAAAVTTVGNAIFGNGADIIFSGHFDI